MFLKMLLRCAIHTECSLIQRTVYVVAGRAFIRIYQGRAIGDVEVPVYEVPGTYQRVWSTSQRDALYLGALRRERRKQ